MTIAADPGGHRPAVHETWGLPVLGFRNYWYPVMKSRDLGQRPRQVIMLGEAIVFWRDGDKVSALEDRCAHRGVPLSQGKVQFPGTGTISCPYHGWTYDGTGQCRAAIAEGPASPIVPKVRIRAYPTAERFGLIWTYMGEGAAPPLEEDLPKPFLLPNACVNIQVGPPWRMNWRQMADNMVDDLHARYLHRGTPKFLFKKVRAWGTVTAKVTDDNKGVVVRVDEDQKALLTDREQAIYPGLGRFPRFKWWRYQRKSKHVRQVAPDGSVVVAGGNTTYLPAVIVVPQYTPNVNFIQWAVPVDENSTRIFNLLVGPRRGLSALLFRLNHFLVFQWTQDRLFIGQDQRMVEGQEMTRERLSASDIPVIVWRRFAVENARGHQGPRPMVATDVEVPAAQSKDQVGLAR